MNPKLLFLYKLLILVLATRFLWTRPLNQFLANRHGITDNASWKVKEIIFGDRLILANEQKTIEVYLCGISANYNDDNESKEYLRSALLARGARSLLNKGNLVLDIVKKDDGIIVAEVFVQTLPDYEREIHLNTEMVTAGMAVLQNPDICPSAEYLKIAESIVN